MLACGQRVVSIPFTTEQFLRVFAEYNQGVWPVQAALYLPAMLALFLSLKGKARSGKLISASLALLWLWAETGVPVRLIVIPLAWSIIGFSAAWSLSMTEDFGLVVAGLVGSSMIIARNRKQFQLRLNSSHHKAFN